MSLMRKILNLPEKESGEEFVEAVQARARGRAPEEPAGAPGEKPRRGTAQSFAWPEERESAGTSAARKGGRIALWAVIGLAAFTGVKTWVAPAKPPVLPAVVDKDEQARLNDVPALEAQQVAARFARNYLTWNDKAPGGREKELAADLPKGADLKAGWNGQGAQQVAQTIPGAVTQLGGKRARVSVSVRVSYTTGAGDQQKTVSDWKGLQVPVAVAGDRVVVSGQPALTGDPVPVAAPSASPVAPDLTISAATRETVKDFLSAWAGGTEVQAAAPGAAVAPLGGGQSMQALDGWSVDPGDGDRRTGTALVRWQIAGAQLQQTYRITLAQVSAAGVSRWQVWSVTSL